MPELGRTLLILGVILVIGGLIVLGLGKMGVGRLPGDFVVRRGNFTLFFPLATSIIISLVLSLALWLFRR